MNEKKEILHPVSDAERCRFFEKIFKELQIAPVDCQYVCAVKKDEYTWLKKPISRKFYTLDCSCYQIGKYAIVWKARSNEVLFLMECEQPFEMFSLDEYDFFIRKTVADSFQIERYTWNESNHAYEKTTYDKGFVPEDFKETHRTGRKHDWSRLRPHRSPDIRSLDNSIYYDFIVKYC